MSEWIRVKDDLPKKDGDVLSYHEDWGKGVARYKEGTGFDAEQILIPFVCPSHWMEMPEDPK